MFDIFIYTSSWDGNIDLSITFVHTEITRLIEIVYIHGRQRMNPIDFSESLTFLLVPSAGQSPQHLWNGTKSCTDLLLRTSSFL